METAPSTCYTEAIMYLGIDIGGTKTLVASLTDEGIIIERVRFETPRRYVEFLVHLEDSVASLTTKEFIACGVGAPGRIDRKRGIGVAMGNLPWKNVNLQADVKKLVHCPVIVDNDANLAGLSEAMLVKHDYDRVLYITISTGIGTGIIINHAIDPAFADSEGGHIMLEHNDQLERWEDFASGSAIVRRYGKKAQDITDDATWRHIAHDLAVGLIDLVAVVQPQIVVFGGSVGKYLDRFAKPLRAALRPFETPLVPIPKLAEAKRPDDAVLYGCYDLAKSVYGRTDS
jgi:predicted NBD/HSP70 family sugar kinase